MYISLLYLMNVVIHNMVLIYNRPYYIYDSRYYVYIIAIIYNGPCMIDIIMYMTWPIIYNGPYYI